MFYNFVLVLLNVVLRLVFRIEYVGRENMPKEGGVLLAVNHRSNWDPVFAGLGSPRHLRFMAKEELFKNPIFGKLITSLGAFPVSRGSGDVGAVRAAFKILKEDNVMLMFPEGHRMKNGQRGTVKRGVATIAHRCKVPVVPMYISGDYKWMSKITVTIGKPLTFEEYYGQKLDSDELHKLSEKIMDSIWELKD